MSLQSPHSRILQADLRCPIRLQLYAKDCTLRWRSCFPLSSARGWCLYLYLSYVYISIYCLRFQISTSRRWCSESQAKVSRSWLAWSQVPQIPKSKNKSVVGWALGQALGLWGRVLSNMPLCSQATALPTCPIT